MEAHRQSPWSARMDRGLSGAGSVARDVDVAAVVDVLSFTTTLSVAADRGTVVLPFPWRDDRAALYAAEHDAVLAVGRTDAAAAGTAVSLSAATVRRAVALPRLVLPSPNGSTLCFRLADTVPDVVGVALRNRRAVAAWLLGRRLREPGLRVAVIAAGERWPDGGLRPAVEDR